MTLAAVPMRAFTSRAADAVGAAGVYLTIRNLASTPDELIAVRSPVSRHVVLTESAVPRAPASRRWPGRPRQRHLVPEPARRRRSAREPRAVRGQADRPADAGVPPCRADHHRRPRHRPGYPLTARRATRPPVCSWSQLLSPVPLQRSATPPGSTRRSRQRAPSAAGSAGRSPGPRPGRGGQLIHAAKAATTCSRNQGRVRELSGPLSALARRGVRSNPGGDPGPAQRGGSGPARTWRGRAPRRVRRLRGMAAGGPSGDPPAPGASGEDAA